MQEILFGIDALPSAIGQCRRPMLVCDGSYRFLGTRDKIDSALGEKAGGSPLVVFSSFASNPLYEDVCKGVDLFRREGCDCILAVGGGSSLDTAKCIKLFGGMDPRGGNYLTREWTPSDVKLIAIPTTAGTGSESTRYAVIYFEGKKQSITHEGIIPNIAILDGEALRTLPPYQRKCTLLDALCQGIESWWSVNSTPESVGYSRACVEGIMRDWRGYINDDNGALYDRMMLHANYGGRAICVTQTTAPHAFSYKLTSTYGLPHGHAVAVCLPEIWAFMIGNMQGCVDPRGQQYLWGVFCDIASALGAGSPSEGVDLFRSLLGDLHIENPVSPSPREDIEMLSGSVNPLRLSNNPVRLTGGDMAAIYSKVLGVS